MPRIRCAAMVLLLAAIAVIRTDRGQVAKGPGSREDSSAPEVESRAENGRRFQWWRLIVALVAVATTLGLATYIFVSDPQVDTPVPTGGLLVLQRCGSASSSSGDLDGVAVNIGHRAGEAELSVFIRSEKSDLVLLASGSLRPDGRSVTDGEGREVDVMPASRIRAVVVHDAGQENQSTSLWDLTSERTGDQDSVQLSGVDPASAVLIPVEGYVSLSWPLAGPPSDESRGVEAGALPPIGVPRLDEATFLDRAAQSWRRGGAARDLLDPVATATQAGRLAIAAGPSPDDYCQPDISRLAVHAGELAPGRAIDYVEPRLTGPAGALSWRSDSPVAGALPDYRWSISDAAAVQRSADRFLWVGIVLSLLIPYALGRAGAEVRRLLKSGQE